MVTICIPFEMGEKSGHGATAHHADILAAQFGFTDTSKTVATPGVRTKMTESQLEKDAAFYRSACMRLDNLSMDRTELQYVAKECARGIWLCRPKDITRS